MATRITGRRGPLGLIGLLLALLVFASAIFSGAALAATAPKITTQPVNQTVEEGQSVIFTAAASGSPTPTVQWEISVDGGTTWLAIEGATSTQYTIASANASEDGYRFRAVFKNEAGKATSKAATLTVRAVPAITKQPQSTTVEEGQTATFEATASGFPAPTVQWELSIDGGATWSAIEGASSNKLTIEGAIHAEDGHRFRAVFTNAAGTATSQQATLTVRDPPVVTQEPANATVQAGQPATFQASASGFPIPTAQWERSTDGGKTWSAVAGASSEQLTIAEAQLSENGHQYRVTFTNSGGTATSDPAMLTVATSRYSALAWGQNLFRQLGDGSFESLSDLPVPVSGLQYVTAVAAGGRHSLALMADGTVMAWGNNSSGQLGDGTTTLRSVPVQVSALSGVKAIAAGANHSLALLNNGTVMA